MDSEDLQCFQAATDPNDSEKSDNLQPIDERPLHGSNGSDKATSYGNPGIGDEEQQSEGKAISSKQDNQEFEQKLCKIPESSNASGSANVTTQENPEIDNDASFLNYFQLENLLLI